MPRQPQRPAASATAALPDTETTLSNEEVYRMIAETAYFKAKARGFEPGGEVQDWIEAEAEVRRRVQNGDSR
jgi:hypothetical protein